MFQKNKLVKEFLEEYSSVLPSISRQFNKNVSKIKWKNLENIYLYHSEQLSTLESIAFLYVKRLQNFRSVHAVKYRIKSSDSLIKKIIFKIITKKVSSGINFKNYQTCILDIIGIRAIYLYQYEWKDIHEQIDKTWRIMGRPELHGYETDLISSFKPFKFKPHRDGYRSIHYTLKFSEKLTSFFIELQTRTMFDDAWSEINHKTSYKLKSSTELEFYMQTFNYASRLADEMGTFSGKVKDLLISPNMFSRNPRSFNKIFLPHISRIRKLKIALVKNLDGVSSDFIFKSQKNN